MKALSLYEEKNTLIHRIDPLSKILYIVTAVAIPAIIPLKTVALACLFFSLLLLILGKVIRKIVPLISFSFLILISIVIIQGLFKADNVTPLFSIGSLTFYKEGFFYSIGICLRVLNILCAFSILVLTTKPSDLIEALVRKGLSPRIGYILSSVLQIIPEMTATMGTITDAQRSRGMETEGKLMVRIKAFFPLIGPVVMNSLINTRERSMALEVRAFNSRTKKTFLNEEFSHRYSLLIKIVLMLSIVAAVIWRIVA